MYRLVFSVLALLGVSCGDGKSVTTNNIGEAVKEARGQESVDGRQVCRYQLNSFPQTKRLFEITTQGGGRTCYSGRHVVVIMPKGIAPCEALLPVTYERVDIVTPMAAETEYVRCSALSADSTHAIQSAIVFTKSRDNDQDVADAFLDFSLDLAALISNDGLPATYYYAGGGEICVESAHLDRVREQIREFQIVDPDHIREVLRPEGCGRAS